jgi:peptide/nickel transport system permease protein
MLVYSVRRLLAAIPVLLAASMFVFLLVDISGDPLLDLLLAEPPTPLETIERERERLYQDRSIPERYWLWMTGLGQTNGDIGLLQGKFGPSTRGTAFDIGTQISDRLFITLRLVLVATIASIVIGVITGVVSAVRQYSKLDHTLTFVGFVALAMPIFWLAALIKEAGVFANQQVFGSRFFSVVGEASTDTRAMSGWEKFTDATGHLILPTLALMLSGYAVISRFQRASMLEVLNSDYVRLARAKGVRNRVVMRRHALRTALIPVTTLAVVTLVTSIDGVVLTEVVFEWQGLGRFFVGSVAGNDSYAVMGWLMLSGVMLIIANLVADLLYAVLDPRIRYE